MRKNKIELLKKLVSINSPSGFESNIDDFIKKELINYIPKKNLIIDQNKNLIVKIEGKSPKSIMLEAHADTIGFIVTNVDSRGLISIQYIGGGCKQILTSRYLNILTSKGTVVGVVDRKPPHLITDEDNEAIDNISDLQLDIGIRGRKEVLSRVKIGDPIVYPPYFEMLSETKNQGQFVGAQGLDDKSGCFMLIETIKEIIKLRKKPEYTLYFIFSAREEIGNPPKRLVRELKPELYIGIDVTFATDYGDGSLERIAGKCDLGKGIVLYRGVNIDNETIKLMTKVAKRDKIKVQYQASVGNIGYNATSMVDICYKTVIVAPPLRNMHNICEIINLRDLEYGIRLLKNFLSTRDLKKLLEI